MSEGTETPRSVIGAVILALLFGPLGMTYVGRFMVASAILIVFCVVAGTSMSLLRIEGSIMVGLLFLLYWLLILPVWAFRRAREMNEPVEIDESVIPTSALPETVVEQSRCPECGMEGPEHASWCTGGP